MGRKFPLPRRLITLKENAGMALETLWDQKLRTFLTMLGVFIGVVIVTAIASVLNGFRDNVVSMVQEFGTNVIYVHRFPFIRMGRPDRNLRRRKPLTVEDAWAIQEFCSSVSAVSPMQEAPFWLSTARARGEQMDSAVIRGVFPATERVSSINVGEGRFFTGMENQHRMNLAVIGHNVAEALFPNITPLGREIEISGGNRVRVVGVLEKYKEGPFGEENREDSVVMVPYNAFRKFYPWLEDNLIAVEAKPGMLFTAQEEITDLLRRRRGVRWNEDNDFEIGTADSIIATFDQIIFGAMAVMVILSSVAFMVGGVGVMNIMLASVKERTAEIGMRKAIGARRRDIIWQFLVEAMTLTGTGGVVGILVGLFAGWLLHVLTHFAFAIPPWGILLAFLTATGIGLFFGMYPAIKAARLDPVETLRWE